MEEIHWLFVKGKKFNSNWEPVKSSFWTNEPIYARVVKVNWVFEVEMLQSGLALHKPPLPQVRVLISGKNAGQFI